MNKEIGALLLFLGLVFTFNCSRARDYNSFLLQILLGPIFIGLGIQLIK